MLGGAHADRARQEPGGQRVAAHFEQRGRVEALAVGHQQQPEALHPALGQGQPPMVDVDQVCLQGLGQALLLGVAQTRLAALAIMAPGYGAPREESGGLPRDQALGEHLYQDGLYRLVGCARRTGAPAFGLCPHLQPAEEVLDVQRRQAGGGARPRRRRCLFATGQVLEQVGQVGVVVSDGRCSSRSRQQHRLQAEPRRTHPGVDVPIEPVSQIQRLGWFRESRIRTQQRLHVDVGVICAGGRRLRRGRGGSRRCGAALAGFVVLLAWHLALSAAAGRWRRAAVPRQGLG